MQLFIKAAEIWQINPDDQCLVLGSSDYSNLAEFASFALASVNKTFAYGEGLPGQTWAVGYPLVWKDLENSAFQRTAEAKAVGIVCGVSIPIFAGDFLLAVLVLFFSDEEGVSGALEIWSNEDNSQSELRLKDGYYGELERFEWISQRLSIMRGRGLPGAAWEQKKPVLVPDLSSNSTFLRARNAAEAGIRTGLAIPLATHTDKIYILTLLSAKGTPIARRFETWLYDANSDKLVFEDGYCAENTDLKALHQDVQVVKGKGDLGAVWLSGRPLISPKGAYNPEGATVLFPVINGCQFVGIVALVL